MLVGTIVQRAARRYADRVALDGPQGTQTFAELGHRVARLAAGLRALGIQPGDRVLDLQPNQNTYVETDLACCTAGLTRVALNHRLLPDDWARIADDCGATALIYDARYEEQTAALRGGLRHTVVIGDGPGIPYDTVDAPPRAHDAKPDDLVSLNYTSGTTGRPKGVHRTHRVRFASLVNMVSDVLQRTPGHDDVYVHAGPITHTSGLFVLPFLAFGARQLILPAFDPEAVVEAVVHRGGTHTALVPTMVARLLAHGKPLPTMKTLAYAGAPMPPEQIRQARERLTPNLVQYYGLVEAIPPVTVLTAGEHAHPELHGSAGRPALGVELSIMDGEVATRGDHVAPGVPRTEDGWFRTGDLGRIDADGRLWLGDRKGDMIITGGYNVYPREVEDVIAEVPGIAEVAVIGVADDDWGQRIVAVYSGPADPAVVEKHCRDRLAGFKVPKELRRVDTFPLNATGKIDKRALR